MSSKKKENIENAKTKKREKSRKNQIQLSQRSSFFELLIETGNSKLAKALERTQKVIKTRKQCTCNLDTLRIIKKRGRIWVCSKCNGWIPYNVGLVIKKRARKEKPKSSRLVVTRKIAPALEIEKKILTLEPQGRRRKPPGRVGYIFLYFGIIALISSIVYNSSILAFTGLSLTLWGGLMLYARPARYVKEDVLDSVTISSLMNIDKILTDLNYKGKAVHLPPRHLKELKEGIVFIPKTKEVLIPPTKEVTQGKVFLNPHGIRLTTPGQGLLTLYEEKLGTDLSKTDLNYLKNNLPKLLIEDLKILEDLEINEQDDRVHVKMKFSAYKDLCSQVREQTNICSHVGCPLCSSIMGALAKATDKAVVSEKTEISSDGKTVERSYRLIKY